MERQSCIGKNSNRDFSHMKVSDALLGTYSE